MLSLHPHSLQPYPIAREEVIGLLTPALGDAAARVAVYRMCDAIGLHAAQLTVDEALALLDRLAGAPGLLGITARFAKTRAILTWAGR